MSVGEMDSTHENKIISDSDMCCEDSTEDCGSMLQQRWFSRRHRENLSEEATS